ncbi:uncharacterized protein N7487_008658 [Penicillium crustosum]|uniref:uncharacterized protein n=1 Tax=Penicillium crustosum TaxID=36656 RepID=UPI0023953E40|nr:uncharacterized protein N7487_008658 [Penicillium crustosum]KAJ5402762.1 hypothetical protein N7487_008658 [Penicillium crustosum]
MAVFEQTTNENGLHNHITSTQVHTWEEVLEVVNKASAIYNSKSGAWNKIRIAFHNFGKNNKAFNAWLGLLPTESDWVSVISGGLKLILGAAARLADLRTEISTALEEIPCLLACTHRATNIFNKPRELRQCSTALYVTTLKLLNHILSWYKKKSLMKITGSMFKQSTYNNKLSDLVQDLKLQSERFESLARTSEMLQAHDLRTHQNHNELFECLESSFARFDTFKYQLHSENLTNRRALQTMNGRLRDLQIITERFLACHDRLDPNTGQDYLRARDKALVNLNFENRVVLKDVATCLGDVWKLPRDAQDRIIAIIQSSKLQTWISTNKLTVIFINSNARSNETLCSFIPANLIDSVEALKINNVFTISFFCGMHSRSDDLNSGVTSLMKSLIGQLLMSYPDFGLQAVREISQGDRESIDVLCQIFHRLILQLPSDVILFCLIDAITIYETSYSHIKDCEVTLNGLIEIVEQTQDYGCVFKLMFTNPQNSHRFYKLVPDQAKNVIWIPGRVPRTGGLTANNTKMRGLFHEI